MSRQDLPVIINDLDGMGEWVHFWCQILANLDGYFIRCCPRSRWRTCFGSDSWLQAILWAISPLRTDIREAIWITDPAACLIQHVFCVRPRCRDDCAQRSRSSHPTTWRLYCLDYLHTHENPHMGTGVFYKCGISWLRRQTRRKTRSQLTSSS